jgi:hypothetical protein
MSILFSVNYGDLHHHESEAFSFPIYQGRGTIYSAPTKLESGIVAVGELRI